MHPRLTAEISLVFNNQNYTMSIKYAGWLGFQTYYGDLVDGNYSTGSGLLAMKMTAVEQKHQLG